MVYGADHAEVYDVVFRSRGKDFAGEAKSLAGVIRQRHPEARSLLDLACGTGANLETFAELFDHVEGLDYSADMLAVARRRLPRVPLHEGDMRTFDLGRTFDALTCLGNSVACMTSTEDLDRAVARMAAHVVPGGVLVVEPWFFPENYLDGHVSGHTLVDNGRVISRTTRSQRVNDTTRHEVKFVIADQDGIRDFTDVLVVSLFTREQYVTAFERAGCPVELLPALRLESGRPNGPGLFVAVRS